MCRSLSLALLSLLAASSEAISGPDFSPVRTFLESSVEEGKVAGGSVLVMQRGVTVYECGFGFSNLKTKDGFRVDTPAVIASISKPLLGTAAFHLAEAGHLDLTGPISRYLPEFRNLELESGEPANRAPTMIELFTHTSGLRGDHDPGGRPWFALWTKDQPLSEVVARYAREFPLKAQPGTRSAYSGIGTDVAARVAETAAKLPRNELLVREVCRPLGMEHTCYRDATSLKRTGPMPTRYYRGENGKLLESRKRHLPKPNTYSSSGGSIISTAPDLARWLLMIRNRGKHDGKAYLSPSTIEKMLQGHSLGKNARSGFFIREKDDRGRATVIGHTGSTGTNCWIDFEHDIIAVMLTQTRGKDIRPFSRGLEERITRCMAGQPQLAK